MMVVHISLIFTFRVGQADNRTHDHEVKARLRQAFLLAEGASAPPCLFCQKRLDFWHLNNGFKVQKSILELLVSLIDIFDLNI